MPCYLFTIEEMQGIFPGGQIHKSEVVWEEVALTSIYVPGHSDTHSLPLSGYMFQPLCCALCCASGSLPISQRILSNATVPCTRWTDPGSRCSIVEQLGWGEGYIRIGGTTREPSAVNHWRTHHRKEEGGYEAGTKHYLTALQTWWSPHQGRSSANWWRANGETQWNFRGTVIKTKVAHSINLDNAQCAHCGNSPLWWLFCEIPFRQSPPFSVFVPLPKQRTLSVSCNLLFNTKSSAQGLRSGSF